jgi:hypothetical protein
MDGGRYWCAELSPDTTGGETVHFRDEPSVSLIEANGATAGVRCADQESNGQLGRAARALTVVSAQSGGLGFLELTSPADDQ